MAESSTLVALSQLVDVSLNCQEGLINFHTLHTLLRVMIQQLGLQDIGVEFRGSDSERIQTLIAGAKSSTGHLMEYQVVPGQKRKSSKGKKLSLQDIKEQMKNEEKKEKELRVIEQRKDSKEDPAIDPLPLKSPAGSSMRLSTVVLVESQSGLPQFSVAVSKSTFEELQDEVQSLKKQVNELTELPGNMGLLEATRTGSSPILDMFQILTLTKRVEANEKAISKLGSLFEDVLKQGGHTEMIEAVQDMKQSIDLSSRRSSGRSVAVLELETRLGRLEEFVNNISVNMGGAKMPPPDGASIASKSRRSTATQQSDKVKIWDPKKDFESALNGINLSELPPEEALVLIQQEFNNLRNWIDSNIKDVSKVKGTTEPGEVNLGAIETKFSEYTKQMKELDTLYAQQIGMLNEQQTSLQTEMTEVLAKIELILPGGDSTAINAETTMDLANKLVLLEKEIITVSDKAAELQAEKEERDKNIDAILEQIDILKIVKANREDLEDALGDKADACQINRKVSHDQFDAACDDLSRGIEEALTKLQEQEEMWHQALDAIQKDVGNKLDRMEVDPLRDFVNSKLKALQEKFKSLTALKRDQEAAGTKSKLLRDVNCISCDKDVVMRKEMDTTLKPKPYAMPPSRNMAPYLAYELDQLRKQQKCVPGSKNLNFFESAVKTRASKDKDHVCNRYCGGSHTVTTPQQRVTRLGHFLEQWGPEIAPLNEEYIRGKDNQMYRARDESMQQKMSKAENQSISVRPSVKINKDDTSVTKDMEAPQTDRNTFVSSSAQELISQDAAEKPRGTTDSRKLQRIGSAARELDNRDFSEGKFSQTPGRASQDIIEAQAMAQASQAKAELRASQADAARASQAQTGEARASQAETGEARGSQAQTGEARASQAQTGEARASQAQGIEAKSSKTGEPRASQTPAVEEKSSKTGERTSHVQLVEPKASQGSKASQTQLEQSGSKTRASHGEVGARASQSAEKKTALKQTESKSENKRIGFQE